MFQLPHHLKGTYLTVTVINRFCSLRFFEDSEVFNQKWRNLQREQKKKSNTIKNFKLQYFTHSFLEHSICLYIRPQSLSFYLSDKLSFTIDYRTYIRLDRKYFTFFIVQFSGCISIWGLLSRLWHFLCFSVLIPVKFLLLCLFLPSFSIVFNILCPYLAWLF